MEGEYRGKVRSTRDGRRGMTAVVWCPALEHRHSLCSHTCKSATRAPSFFPTAARATPSTPLHPPRFKTAHRGVAWRAVPVQPDVRRIVTRAAPSRSVCLITREPEYAPPTSRPFCTPAARAPLTVAFANAGANASPYTTSCDARDLRRVRAAHMARARDGARPPR